MRARLFRDIDSAEHSGDFIHAFGGAQGFDCGACDFPIA
jgi:hypothetical protein